MIKYKINGIVTLPAGIAQADELQIDSPTIELVHGSQNGNGNEGEANIVLGMKYTYQQGDLTKVLVINRPFNWDELADAQKQIIGDMVAQSWGLILSIPDHSTATQQ
jgi:hypothetical protein